MPAFLLFGGLVSTVVFSIVWILRPLDRAARSRQCPTQFSIADFLSLFVLVHLVTALAEAARAGVSEFGLSLALLYAYCWISCGTAWWMSVRTLSRAGVRHTWHRAVFLVLVLPMTFFGSIAAPGLVLALVAVVAAGVIGQWEHWVLHTFLLCLAECGVVFALWLAGRFTRRMMAAAVAGPHNTTDPKNPPDPPVCG
ncbi:MAG: hypothetical protein JXB62_11120 [Pirellulales bacterium]|nr:hypothetical protein [Pirellulales bacterium]